MLKCASIAVAIGLLGISSSSAQTFAPACSPIDFPPKCDTWSAAIRDAQTLKQSKQGTICHWYSTYNKRAGYCCENPIVGANGIGTNATSGWVLLVGVLWIVVMTYICYRGIEVSANFQKALLSIELVMLVGHYHEVAFVLNALRVPLDPWIGPSTFPGVPMSPGRGAHRSNTCDVADPFGA